MSDQESTDNSEQIEGLVQEVQEGKLGRRGFLRRAVCLGISSAAAYSLLGSTKSSAQRMTSLAIGEEGSPAPSPGTPIQPRPTTFAVGEENAGPQPPATTQAVGEENLNPQPPQTYPPTTQAVGEENTYPQPPQTYPPTTQAVGEENTYTQPPQTYPPTTQAVGEESTYPQPPQTYPPTTQAVGEENPTSRATTLAVGEEGQPATSYAIGEESLPNPPKTGFPTTLAIGEGSQPATTLIVGEESTPQQKPPTYTTYAQGEESSPSPTQKPTTLRLGEEGISVPSLPSIPSGGINRAGQLGERIQNQIQNNVPGQRIWKNFKRW